MTLLAKHGRARLEHARYGAAMRVMAVGTVISYGLMLMHKRSALFSVAGKTRVTHGAAFGQLFAS